jgi:hypothetical protein
MLSACGGGGNSDNLAALDAKLTNGADNAANNQAAIDPDVLAAVGGTIEKAPAATETKDDVSGSRTLGDLVRRQASGTKTAAAGDDCAKAVQYGDEWAERMPEPFRLYPHGTLTEAAGIDKASCNKLRIISFSTHADIESVIDFYYTQARRAGYDAEHLVSKGEHTLGGTHGEAAYVVFVRRGEGGLTQADVVANAK